LSGPNCSNNTGRRTLPKFVAKAAPTSIVLYDGVCGLCNRLVQFLLKRDRRDRIRFAPLQSAFAGPPLRQRGFDPLDLDTVYVIMDHGQPTERVLARSDAILYVLRQLGGIWNIARLGSLLPRRVRDGIYQVVARNRYRVFGRHDSCLLPEEKYRRKFLDI
jgi:predicted DCC family thiol-disulfide oxidoreductase YuxK